MWTESCAESVNGDVHKMAELATSQLRLPVAWGSGGSNNVQQEEHATRCMLLWTCVEVYV
jgi:hypothetical protein